jgi:hypothetical protein
MMSSGLYTHYYKSGVQFINLNHYGNLKVKHCILMISPWLKLFHYNIIMQNRVSLLVDIIHYYNVL